VGTVDAETVEGSHYTVLARPGLDKVVASLAELVDAVAEHDVEAVRDDVAAC
jgi:hypothetical protein